MYGSEVKIARLDERGLAKVAELEAELGAVVVAYEPANRPANLSEAQLAKVHSLEAELGLILVAFAPEQSTDRSNS